MNNIYKDKKVFLTGHTGFKGAWLALWLRSLGAEVLGYSLEPNTEPSLHKVLNAAAEVSGVGTRECDEQAKLNDTAVATGTQAQGAKQSLIAQAENAAAEVSGVGTRECDEQAKLNDTAVAIGAQAQGAKQSLIAQAENAAAEVSGVGTRECDEQAKLNDTAVAIGAQAQGAKQSLIAQAVNAADGVIGDILDKEKLENSMQDFNPDIVFHLAAQPLVRLSYSEPLLTYQTNVIGSLNVLEAARKCSNVKAFVNVTTDKCYENKEISRGYCEDEPMGGYDMYSSSKGCVEIMSSSYRRSFLSDGYAMATARAGNVIGGGDWAQDRLIPDCVKFINAGEKIEIRNPVAVRPWQHVLEPLSGYLLLGQKLLESGQKYAQGFNFGPNEDSVLKVCDVAQKIVEFYGKGEVVVHKKDDLHEANLLMLNIEKAEKVLGWKPVYSADEAIEKTVEWYKRFYNGEDMRDFTLCQIKEYEEKST